MPFRNHSQHELDHAVAAVTGEDLGVIQSRGFSLVDPDAQDLDFEPDWRPPQLVDWDELELSRNCSILPQPRSSLLRVA